VNEVAALTNIVVNIDDLVRSHGFIDCAAYGRRKIEQRRRQMGGASDRAREILRDRADLIQASQPPAANASERVTYGFFS
jgi:hypothetical protein